MNALSNLSAQQLRQAAAIKERIDALQIQLNRLLGGFGGYGANAGAPRRIPAANVRRAPSKPRPASAPASRPKRTHLSAAARARLAAIARARWKKVKAEGRLAL